ncbi:MAG: DEAD/DEAH box helicase [Myxococcales bacterium]|nr:DEAD/DEAH box helicase [Myxococcales bacterium]
MTDHAKAPRSAQETAAKAPRRQPRVRATQLAEDPIEAEARRFVTLSGRSPTAVQRAVFHAYPRRRAMVVIAPTGSGKTLAVMAPLLIDVSRRRREGAGTRVVYIAPVRALADGHAETLSALAAAIDPKLKVGLRTGDTTSHARAKLKRTPPAVLITTPESLAVMLGTDTRETLGAVEAVVLDEIHLLCEGKRGALLSATLGTLDAMVRGRGGEAPRRLAMSATVADREALAAWVHPEAEVVAAEGESVPAALDLADPKLDEAFPDGGWAWTSVLPFIARRVMTVRGAMLLFVGSRTRAESWAMALRDVLPTRVGVACFHGSLSADARRDVAAGLSDGSLHCVVATSALEVGVDLPRVTDVLTLGAPTSITRLRQAAGRADHRPGMPPRATLVPVSATDLVRCVAVLSAAAAGQLEPVDLRRHDRDVLIQAALGRIALGPVTAAQLREDLGATAAFVGLDAAALDDALHFLSTGGDALAAYDEMARITRDADGRFDLSSARARRRYLQGIGTIVSEPSVAVLYGRAVVGQLDGRFASLLGDGDRFVLAGRTWRIAGRSTEGLRVRPDRPDPRAVPTWDGGRAAASTVVTDTVAALWSALNTCCAETPRPDQLSAFERLLGTSQTNARAVLALVRAQRRASAVPCEGAFTLELIATPERQHLVLYTFAGNLANEVIARVVAARLRADTDEGAQVSAHDDAACVSFSPAVSLDPETLRRWLAPTGLYEDFMSALAGSVLASAYFREVARIAQLWLPDPRKGAVTPGLLHDVLSRHDPEHILLRARDHTLWVALEGPRAVAALTARATQPLNLLRLNAPSPFAVSVLAWAQRDAVAPSDPERALADAAHALWRATRTLDDLA